MVHKTPYLIKWNLYSSVFKIHFPYFHSLIGILKKLILVFTYSKQDKEDIKKIWGVVMEEETKKKTKFCSNCGEEIDLNAEICPKCGVRLIGPPKATPTKEYRVIVEEKSPGLAAVLSFFIPGLGQIYNGQIGKGLLLLVLAMLSAGLIIIIIGIIPYLIIWLFSIFDAYSTANRINRGEIP
jgi:TM2 domain-containing membrane protein YozV/ribosomal protein S27AE